ncbi:hypothetical protein PLESTB_000270500 [Pleodorina starrii]|uniref:Ankyrin repeat domain-containing protein n=1 Tax=Pleodorina starrii TaxID=330485 RepID=A0A9W6BDH4_9CHLO|nr:hypothetical protein PLESTB_000270500 [Pleodorina starrii]
MFTCRNSPAGALTETTAADAEVADMTPASRVWWAPGLLDNIVSSLQRNEISCSIRLVDRRAAALFDDPEHKVVHISEAVPRHAFKRRWGSPGAMKFLTLKKRQELTCLTAASGDPGNLEVALEAAGCVLSHEPMDAAAGAGQLEACKWLRERGYPVDHPRILSAAARGGHQATCEWLLASGCCPWSADAVYAAVRGGHVGLMLWLLDHRSALAVLAALCPRTRASHSLDATQLLSAAVQGCDLDTYKRLHTEWLPQRQQQQEQQPPNGGGGGGGGLLWRRLQLSREEDFAAVLTAAAASPGADWRAKVEWLEELLPADCPKPAEAVEAASLLPDGIERLTWLRRRGYPVRWSWDWALRAGGAPHAAALLQLMADEGQTFGGMLASVAAGCGDVVLPRALHDAAAGGGGGGGGPLPARCLEWVAGSAAEGGHAEVLAWAVSELGPQGLAACRSLAGDAARRGHVKLLAWLLGPAGPAGPGGGSGSGSGSGGGGGGGAMVGRSDMFAAVLGGCEAALEVLLQHHRGRIQDPASLYRAAATSGDLTTLRWLRRRVPYRLDERFFHTCLAQPDPLPLLRWLTDEAGYWPPMDLSAVVRRAELAGALWLQGVAGRVLAWAEEMESERWG